MRRAAILIGVSTTGGLPELQAVGAGLAQMRAWAASQGIDNTDLVELNDATGKVRAYQVADAIGAMVKRRNLHQLVVYFSGHGVHNRGDIWLLSDAPFQASEAVNVEGSIQAARGCGIPHIVLISDACRTAAEGIRGLGVQGIDIFPNDPVDGLERPIDTYFACARGKPALEIRDPLEAARGFSGIYTEVLGECLVGKHGGVIDMVEVDGAPVAQVGAWKLADFLAVEVPKRIKTRLGKPPSVNQTPVGRITSREGWISRLANYQPAGIEKSGVDVLGGAPVFGLSAVEASDRILREVLGGRPRRGEGLLGGEERELSAGEQLWSTVADLAAPLRPMPRLAQSMFRLRGERGHMLHLPAGPYHVVEAAQKTAFGLDGLAAPVQLALELDSGRSALLPAFPGWVAELVSRSDELLHVAFRRLGEGGGAPDTAASRELLATLGASSGMGVLRLDAAQAGQLEALVAASGTLDPSLAVYLAYAYHDAGERGRILPLHHRLLAETGFSLFDVAMLAGGEHLAAAQRNRQVFPAAPLLSRGWSLLGAFRARIPAPLAAMEAELRPSVWTLFSGAATEKLIAYIHSGGAQP